MANEKNIEYTIRLSKEINEKSLGSFFENLPKEITNEILEYLPLKTWANTLPLVNKKFFQLGNNNELWKKIAKNTFEWLKQVKKFLFNLKKTNELSKKEEIHNEEKVIFHTALKALNYFLTEKERFVIDNIKKIEDENSYSWEEIKSMKKVASDLLKRVSVVVFLNNPHVTQLQVYLTITWYLRLEPESEQKKRFYENLNNVEKILENLDKNNFSANIKSLYFNTLVHFSLWSPYLSNKEVIESEIELKEKKDSIKVILGSVQKKFFNKTLVFKKEINDSEKLEKELTAAKERKDQILSSTELTLFASAKKIEAEPVVTSPTKQEEKKPSL